MGRRLMQVLLVSCGTVCVALGVLGVFLPLLPTTVFLLLATMCYARSSERFYQKLVNHRWLGVYIRNYREGRGMTRREKAVTLHVLWIGIGSSMMWTATEWWMRLGLLAVAIGVTVHVARLKAQRPVRASDPTAAAGLLTLVVAVLASATALSGQQPAQTPVFRGVTDLVRVDVTVRDGAGRPVPGLKADDFEIMLDGRVHKVQTVDYRSTPTKRAVSATSERQATNATPQPASRLVVMLVDDLSIAAMSARDLFHAASRFVATLPAADRVGFTTTSGEAVLNPTHDHQAVEIALRRSVGRFVDPRNQPPDVDVGLNEAIEIEKGNRIHFVRAVERNCLQDQKGRPATERDLKSQCADEVQRKAKRIASLMQQRTALQVASYKAVINAMRPFEGDKALVILSDGLTTGNSPIEATDLKALERDGATAGVQVSVLFPEPDSVSMTARSPDEAKTRREDGQALKIGLQNIAGATGGDFYGIVGQPERFFGFVADAMSAVYHLGVEAPAGSAPGREYRLSARVTRPDVTVRASRVALQEAPAAPIPVDAQLDAVIARGEPKYGVPIAVGTAIRPGRTPDETALSVNVEVPGSVPGPLTVVFAAVDDNGKSRTGRHALSAQTAGGNYRLSFSIPVPSASYRLRIGVADGQGQVGSLELPVAAQLNRAGPFRMSDILTAWTGPDGKAQFLSLGRVPVAATGLLMGLELATATGTAPPAGVRVTWTILTESGQTVAEQTVAAAGAETRLNAQTQVSVASLAPGTYELRATVLVAGQSVGVTSMTFRKADRPLSCLDGVELIAPAGHVNARAAAAR